jgi:aspartate-semialdehyde dehydrogenase
MEIIDNALPYIGGEEDKMETESRKLLGEFDGAEIDWHDVDVAASCNRVPTLDGHLENAFVDLADDPDISDVEDAMREFPGVDLPSAPNQLIHVFDEPERPQPRMDRMRGGGMQICVGGVQSTSRGVKFNCLAHNTVRGAAGASMLNGELLHENGYL